MRRWLLLALVLFALESVPVQANHFGQSRRPAETRSAYYYAPSYYAPSYYAPSYYAPSVIYYPATPAPVYYSMPVFPMFPAQPVQPVVQSPFAVPRAAPPSTTEEPPMSPTPRTGSTAMRFGESFYQVLPGPPTMRTDGEPERCSVAFWNLTRAPVALRINNSDYTVGAGQSLTLELPPTFAWHIAGREAEATRIPTGRATAEILIRR